MKPESENERKEFVDLMYRAMFYISLDDKYLQQALSDLKAPNPTIKTYFDEAVAAESRRKSFQDITQSSTCLDGKGVNISKWDVPFSHKIKFHTKSESKTAATSVNSKSDASDSTQGKDSKGGNKGQKQNFSEQKCKQQNSNQTKSKSETKR